MITEIEDYFSKGCGRCERFDTPDCSTAKWAEGLSALRRICLDLGLVETVKWGHPTYMHAGRNVAILGALRSNLRITFFHASLLSDPHHVLERQGPNTQHADVIRFTENPGVVKMEPVVRAYLREAMGYAEAGIKPTKEARALELPPELSEALSADPELEEAFHLLTPGRQKSYVIHLSSTKKPETRVKRIDKFRLHILAGKGATER